MLAAVRVWRLHLLFVDPKLLGLTQRPNNYMGETSEPDSHHTVTRHWAVTKHASKRAAATIQSPDAHSGQHNVQTSNVSIFV